MAEWMLKRLSSFADQEAFVCRGRTVTYAQLSSLIDASLRTLSTKDIGKGAIVHMEADHSPEATAMLFALLITRSVVAITSNLPLDQRTYLAELAESGHRIIFDRDGNFSYEKLAFTARHPLLDELRQRNKAGLVIFSSGSTGKSKATVHAADALVDRYKTKQPASHRVLTFMVMDHIGGLNTLFRTLLSGGTAIIPEARTPAAVASAIAQHKATALTTTPSFLRMLLVSGVIEQFDLSSLAVVNFSSEPMPSAMLTTLQATLPNVRFMQSYGLSELGTIPAHAEQPGSLFFRIPDSSGIRARVRDGLLEIRTPSAMLGYLNAPSPFTDDGWFKTGDAVEVKGEFIKILGRASDIINVGGLKAYPNDIENILQSMPGVEDVTVMAEPHPLLGQIVLAKVRLSTGENLLDFSRRMRMFCQGKIASYMVPQKVILAEHHQHNPRFKKTRNRHA